MPPSPEQKSARLQEYKRELITLRQEFPSRLKGADPNFECPEIDIREFTIHTRLGKGGFGIVYAGLRRNDVQHPTRIYAIKIQEKEKLFPDSVEEAVNERKFLTAMDSPLICKLYGKWQDNTNLYLYLEYAMYGCLTDVIKKARDDNGRGLTEDLAIKYMCQIVCGLEYLHACNIIYRDLKPGNCLLYIGGRLKLGDFGLSVMAASNIRDLCGTYPYCAPEMYLEVPYTCAVDWWAAGIVMYRLLSGEYAFGLNLKDDTETMKMKVMGDLVLNDEPFSAEAKDLLSRFLERVVVDRLGSGPNAATVVKQHAWFRGVDWYKTLFEEIQFDQTHPLNPGKNKPAKKDAYLEDISPSSTQFGSVFNEF